MRAGRVPGGGGVAPAIGVVVGRAWVVVASMPETYRLGPFAVFELSIIRILNWRIFRNLRSNIVALLQRVPEENT